MDDLDYEERDYSEMVLAEAEESAEIIEREKMLDEKIDEVTEQSYAKGKASAQDEFETMAKLCATKIEQQQAEIDRLTHRLFQMNKALEKERAVRRASLAEAVNIITELHEQLKEERDDVIWLDAEDFIQQHKGE